MKAVFFRECSVCGGLAWSALDLTDMGVEEVAYLGAHNQSFCRDCWPKDAHDMTERPFADFNWDMFPLVYDSIVLASVMVAVVKKAARPVISKEVLESNINHIRLFSPN